MKQYVALSPLCAAACLLLATLQSAPLRAAEDRLEVPDEKTFVLDKASLISPADAGKIEATGKKLLADHGVHLVVITVPKMSSYGTFNTVEDFARKFLDEWIKAQPDKMWTKAALLVRARDDHKVHIQLGGAWRHTQDKECEKIMLTVLAPKFQAGEVSGGLAAGAAALSTVLSQNIASANIEK